LSLGPVTNSRVDEANANERIKIPSLSLAGWRALSSKTGKSINYRV